MSDFIKREDAIEAVTAYLDLCCMTEARFHKDGKSYNKQIAEELFEDVLTAEPKQGEWITEEIDSIYGKKIRLKCSECGDTFDVTEGAFPYERYCRYCGCRMKGVDDD